MPWLFSLARKSDLEYTHHYRYIGGGRDTYYLPTW